MAAEHPVYLIVDCDPGIDDALALAIVAARVRTGGAVLHAIVAVGGNVGLDHTAPNAVFLAERFGLDVPVFAGAATPMAGAVRGDAVEVHGADGIGGLRAADPACSAEPATPEALADLVASLPTTGGDRVLLAVGPLTNVARMLEVDPDLGRHLDRVVVMGGAFGSPGGNVTPHAEFNAWADPEAWAVVAAAGLPLEVVPLDVTTRVVLGRDDAATLAGRGEEPSLVSRLVMVGADLYDELHGTPVCEMHDPLAAAAVFEPGLLTWRGGVVVVDLEGEVRGQTRLLEVGEGEPTTSIALDVSPARAAGALLADLGRVTDP